MAKEKSLYEILFDSRNERIFMVLVAKKYFKYALMDVCEGAVSKVKLRSNGDLIKFRKRYSDAAESIILKMKHEPVFAEEMAKLEERYQNEREEIVLNWKKKYFKVVMTETVKEGP